MELIVTPENCGMTFNHRDRSARKFQVSLNFNPQGDFGTLMIYEIGISSGTKKNINHTHTHFIANVPQPCVEIVLSTDSTMWRKSSG
jgi:hypothetical protein